MGYSQHTAVHQSATKLLHALQHVGLDGDAAPKVIQDALDRYTQDIDPMTTEYRLQTGEVVTIAVLAGRYDELAQIQRNRSEWAPVWQWMQRLGLLGFVIVAIVWFMGLR